MTGPRGAPEGEIKTSIPGAGGGWRTGAELLAAAAAGEGSSGFASPPHPAPAEGQFL